MCIWLIMAVQIKELAHTLQVPFQGQCAMLAGPLPQTGYGELSFHPSDSLTGYNTRKPVKKTI
ncbi:hypothetical protein QJS04_geneDACA000433 [Acorus gramineus]|uniref:Uncharacterized protein n=1 Tax=Acorus gramineus TaxID=55184 RepID=A0AAV9ANS5_ACOGR|nr:hypothetical protein QJS04_geneDACA000433 [Acorus gramineus]